MTAPILFPGGGTSGPLEIARAAWGDALPEWVEAGQIGKCDKEAVDKIQSLNSAEGQNKIHLAGARQRKLYSGHKLAARHEQHPTTNCLALGHTYKARPKLLRRT